MCEIIMLYQVVLWRKLIFIVVVVIIIIIVFLVMQLFHAKLNIGLIKIFTFPVQMYRLSFSCSIKICVIFHNQNSLF